MRYDIESLPEGYAALYLSIVKAVTPDRAFDMLYEPYREHRKWCDEDIMEIKECRKEGYSWRELGKMFGIDGGSLCRAVRLHTEKKGEKRK